MVGRFCGSYFRTGKLDGIENLSDRYGSLCFIDSLKNELENVIIQGQTSDFELYIINFSLFKNELNYDRI